MSLAILKSRKTKNKLSAIKAKYPTNENTEKYKTHSKIYRNVLRKAKSDYYEQRFQEYSNCMKKTWSTVNELLNSKKASPQIPDIFVHNGKTFTGKAEVTEGFNNYFSTIGSKLASKIPSTESSYESFLRNRVNL